jgi:hypothetical protein
MECPNCDKRLTASNGIIVHVSLMLIFALTFRFYIYKTLESNFILGFVYFIIAVLIFQTLRNILIRFKCLEGET